MHFHNLNLLAVLIAAISTMVVGFLWYSPLLFAKPWMKEMGCDPSDKARMEEMKKSAGPAYGGSFLASLISAFILALFLHEMRVASLHMGLLVGFHVWLGFVATVQFTSALFTKQSMSCSLSIPATSWCAIWPWLPSHRLELIERECHPPAQGAGSAAESHPNGSALWRRTRWSPAN